MQTILLTIRIKATRFEGIILFTDILTQSFGNCISKRQFWCEKLFLPNSNLKWKHFDTEHQFPSLFAISQVWKDDVSSKQPASRRYELFKRCFSILYLNCSSVLYIRNSHHHHGDMSSSKGVLVAETLLLFTTHSSLPENSNWSRSRYQN